MVRLTLLTALQVLVLVGALVTFLERIVTSLEQIGGAPGSFLGKVNFGVRAIEKETSHLAPQVIQLNEGLTTLAGKLEAVDGHLGAVARRLTPEETT